MNLLVNIERTQYSLIYWLYKTKYYKSGKGYIYRSNQLLSLALASIVLAISFNLNKTISNLGFALIFMSSGILFFSLFECNVKKHKMYIHRTIYKSYRKKVVSFFIAITTIILILLSISYL